MFSNSTTTTSKSLTAFTDFGKYLFIVSLAINVAGCISAPAALDSEKVGLYQSAAQSPRRSADDRGSDASRKPVEFLTFAGVKTDMQVLDIAAGGGNTSELLALVVGANGKVYAQNSTARAQLEKRLVDQPQTNLIPIVRPFDDPIPAGTPALDLVTINLSYHDIANLPIDRIKMDRQLFASLKPGGHLVVVDHAAVAGSGANETKTLHRIDEQLVRAEFEQAGFKLEATGDYLRNPADTRTKKSADLDRMSDKFALRFVKPI